MRIHFTGANVGNPHQYHTSAASPPNPVSTKVIPPPHRVTHCNNEHMNETPTTLQDFDVLVERLGTTHYKATNSTGASIEFGRAPGLLTPVELLLAATAGCASVDVDIVTGRRDTTPEHFRVRSTASKIQDADGATQLDNINLTFDIAFPNTPEGQQAEGLIDRVLEISHEKDCTVSRTIEHATPVHFSRGTAEPNQNQRREATHPLNSTVRTQLQRRTIREFTNEPVSDTILEQLFEVAMHTPSSLGLQSSSIINITDQHLRDELARIGEQDYVRRAPIYLLFVADCRRNADILTTQGGNPANAGSVRNFIQAWTDTALMAQTVATAAESLGLGVNFLGNVHNDANAVISLLNLPALTMPVVGMTIGWPAQQPTTKPRLPQRLRVMENGYQADLLNSEEGAAELAAYDTAMANYTDLRFAHATVPPFSAQVLAKNPDMRDARDDTIRIARAQGFEV